MGVLHQILLASIIVGLVGAAWGRSSVDELWLKVNTKDEIEYRENERKQRNANALVGFFLPVAVIWIIVGVYYVFVWLGDI